MHESRTLVAAFRAHVAVCLPIGKPSCSTQAKRRYAMECATMVRRKRRLDDIGQLTANNSAKKCKTNMDYLVLLRC